MLKYSRQSQQSIRIQMCRDTATRLLPSTATREATDLASVGRTEVVHHQILFLQQVGWFVEVPPGLTHQKVGHCRRDLNLQTRPSFEAMPQGGCVVAALQ